MSTGILTKGMALAMDRCTHVLQGLEPCEVAIAHGYLTMEGELYVGGPASNLTHPASFWDVEGFMVP